MSRGVTRESIDDCSGTVMTPSQSTVFANDQLMAILGTSIAAHSPCPYIPIHCCATMSEASEDVFAEGIGICREGDECSCGHTSSGSSDVFVN